MIFRRREKANIWAVAREALYPRKGWRRGLDYLMQRIRRLPDSPHKIAVGFAAGTFVSFTPLFGIHLLAAALIAWALRGNILASVIGTFVGNPLTTPFIALGAMWTGRRLLGRGEVAESQFGQIVHAFSEAFTGAWDTMWSWFGYGPSAWDRLLDFYDQVFLPYLVGGTVTGIAGAIVAYAVARPLIAVWQARRRRVALARIEARAAPEPALPNPAE